MHFERRQRRNDEERILPLINVVFLLLIFFIIAGQLAVTDPFEVEPVTSASEEPAEVPELVVLAGSDGRLALNGQIMDEAELKSALTAHLGGDGIDGMPPGPPVRLKADGRAEAGRIIAVMEILREAGAQTIRLLTVPEPL
jgi:biopolymer transport protein ExbD